MKTITHYKSLGASAAANNKDIVLPVDTTYVIHGISFTADPNIINAVRIIWDPDGADEIQDAAQSDKWIEPRRMTIEGNGSKKLRLQLDNSNGLSGAYLGVTIYYEELS